MTMNEPKLRFKADDGSQFPDWEEKKLGDITEKVVRKDANSNADVRMISQGNGFILQSDKYSRENAGQSLKKYTLLKRDEFAYNHGASKVKPYGVCYRLCESDEARVPYVYHTFKLIDGDSGFWNYSLNTSCMDRQLKKMVSSGARMDGLLNIGYDAYMSVDIHVPSLPEQQKIADFLSTIDTVIEKQKETVSAWEERKKGVMQKLFSQEVRLKADDGSEFPEWEEKKLGEVMSVKDVKQIPTEEAPLMAFIAYQGVAEKGDRYDRSFLVKSDDKKYKRTDFNDFIYSSNNLDVGSIGLNKYGSAVISVVYEIFTFKDGFNPDCMNLLIQQPRIMSSIIRYRQGCLYGQYKIHSRDFLNVLISVPCLAEQQKIADCLLSLDDVIEKQKATLAAWEEMKKGLLQQMFV